MSIGLRLLAKLQQNASNPDQVLGAIASWIHTHCAEVLPATRQGTVDNFPSLFCSLHPGAEEIELSLIDGEHLVASANTSTVGPGYHVYLCSLLQALGKDLDVAWQPATEDGDYGDEANFFFTGNQQNVFDEMPCWLAALARTFFDGEFDSDSSAVHLCMGMGLHFESDQPAVTPLGPRSLEWLKAVSQDGYRGRDFFAWWEPGLNAEYFRDRALTQIWSDVRWRPPSNDSERALLRQVVNSLHTAYRLDPDLEYPWAEWAEILELLDSTGQDADWVRTLAKSPPALGYRRRPVKMLLPGAWSIKLPGSFSDFEMDGNGDFEAVDPPREVWFTAFSFDGQLSPGEFAKRRQETLKGDPELQRNTESYVAKASIKQVSRESGNSHFLLQSSNLCATRRSVLTIVYTEPHDREWAIEAWKSLTPPGPNDGEPASHHSAD